MLKISGAALTGSDTCNLDPKVCGLDAPQMEKQLCYGYTYAENLAILFDSCP